MEEEWRAVVGAEGLYEVSSKGRMRSVSRVVVKSLKATSKRKGTTQRARITGRLLKTQVDAYGYSAIGLKIGPGERRAKICWLVAEAFIGPRPYRYDVCHRNGVRSDDRLENLYYGSRKENIADAIRHGTVTRGEGHVTSKMTGDMVRSLRQEYAAGGVTMQALANKHGMSLRAIHAVIRKETWKHIGDN